MMGLSVSNPNNKHRDQAITDIIESVALQEAGLANILDAEGDKLRKAVDMHHISPCELLKFNRSVEQTLRAVAQLELILQAKLSLFSDCLCPDDDDDEHHKEHCCCDL